MAEIPGWVFIGIGAFVAVASLFFGVRRFILFIVAGAVMVIIGIIKLMSEKKPKRKTHTTIHHVAPPPTNHRQHHIVKYCPHCGISGNLGDYYCSRCGSRLLLHKR